jgi:hypothetical protein
MNWIEANQKFLANALNEVREMLERENFLPAETAPEIYKKNLPFSNSEMSPPPTLETLCKIFELSNFERRILLLCAGIELDSKFSALCAKVNDDPRRDFPTFSLALGVLPEAHWSALTPDAPLRHWHLIEVLPGNALMQSLLKIDERILHYLTGLNQMDSRLASVLEPFATVGDLVDSHRTIANEIAVKLQKNSPLPAIQLIGKESVAKRAIAAAACASMNLNLQIINAQNLPVDARESELLIRLCEREAVLSSSALLLDCDNSENNFATTRFIEHARGVLFVSSREPRQMISRDVVNFEISKPTSDEQRALWKNLGANGEIESLVSQFDLGADEIRAATAQSKLPNFFWEACRIQARPRLDDLAQRIETRADWNDLVLPATQLELLREISAHVRQRTKVYSDWNFAEKSTRGLGISALFSGASGTGKTMAAEVLANELRLDLYKIDLSQVVSKYIGETEKNLRRVFDAAETGGAILFFDEADALFGKRTEVKDSHDRYANIEVSYLLQRMEAYRGLAILTTNMKNAIDPAFLRRIRFVVQFPFPDAHDRKEIWRRMFPKQTPVEKLDFARLAKLQVSGGNIRNIALNAAFLAAAADEPVRMNHLLRASRAECLKIEKPLSDAEIGGWA